VARRLDTAGICFAPVGQGNTPKAGAAAPYRPGPGGEVPTLLRRRRCLIGLDMRSGLDSPNDGREILLETDEMLAAE
jgi:hypothetical protein